MNINILKVFLKDNDFTECTESSYLFNKVLYFFKINNYIIVNNEKEADILFINTCGVWKELEDKVLAYVKENISYDLKIGIFGCLANRSDTLNNIVHYSIPTKQEYLFDDFFKKTNSIKNISSVDINKGTIKTHSIYQSGLKKYFLEINRGCIHNCSYCAIKKSIGYVKSKPLNEVIIEFKYAVDNGYEEIVLVSDDVGSYGYDIKSNFAVLFNEITKIKGNYVININYTEPSEFMKWFPLIKHNFYRVSEIIYPIQSFSNRILKLMRRKYSVEDFIDNIKDMRKYSNDIKITNHIIYGYPTESEEEYKKNLEGVKYFDANLFNLYSYIKGTKKFPNSDRISKIELEKRLKILFKLNKYNHILYDIANKYE